LITEKGWEATTAAEIGRRAGYSRAMVHARYGSKDAILDTLFRTTYEARLDTTPADDADGLRQALGHFDRIIELYVEDRAFVRAVFVLTFEAVKSTSPIRGRMRAWLSSGVETVEAGLRAGLGLAYHWIVFDDSYRLDRELATVRDRIIGAYGTESAWRR
jgi:AcrR family transcriptional regulator